MELYCCWTAERITTPLANFGKVIVENRISYRPLIITSPIDSVPYQLILERMRLLLFSSLLFIVFSLGHPINSTPIFWVGTTVYSTPDCKNGTESAILSSLYLGSEKNPCITDDHVCRSGSKEFCSSTLPEPSSGTPNYSDSYSSSNNTCSGLLTGRILFGPTCFEGKNGPTQYLCGTWGAAPFYYRGQVCHGDAGAKGSLIALTEGCHFLGGFLTPGSDEYLSCPLPSDQPKITHT